MDKILAYIVIFPFAFMIFVQSVLLFEFDLKQRHINNLTELLSDKVKITGILTEDELNEFKLGLNKFAKFDDENIFLFFKSDIDDEDYTDYLLGSPLEKGSVFRIYAKSANQANFSRVQRWGRGATDSQRIFYTSNYIVRVEQVWE
jgi:hypothetical protein